MADKITKHYRKRQIERIENPETDFLPKIQIHNDGKKTKFLDITFEELEKIKEILTK